MPVITISVLLRNVSSPTANGLRKAVNERKSGITVVCTGSGKSISQQTDAQGQCSFILDNGHYSLTTKAQVLAGKTLKPAHLDRHFNSDQSVVLNLAENKDECYAILDVLKVCLADGSDAALAEAEALIAQVKNTYNNYGRLKVLKDIKGFEKMLKEKIQ
jgi:hypothetical protein